MIIFTTVRVFVFALVLVVPVTKIAAPAPDSLASTSSFYTIRHDLRRCASPMCGGYFVKLVNQARTRCANGKSMTECYVASIDWNGQPEADKDGTLIRGTLSTRGDRNGRFGVLRVREIWSPASDNRASGTFFRVRDRGIRCIAAPCETHHEAKLNTSVSRNIAGIDLSGAGAADSTVSEATQVMTSQEGVLVAGSHSPVTGPAGRSQMIKATQFYLPVKSNPGPSTQNPKPCFKTGCSKQVCSDEEVITTCDYKPEYACYQRAKCERQASGQCGFTDTPELRQCLRRN